MKVTALRRGTSKLLELVPNPFDDINKICSKQSKQLHEQLIKQFQSKH